MKTKNPFYITKASEFTDSEINSYWVKFAGKSKLDPLDPTPKYILGGKGCGKTHLLRYYSFPLQLLRNNNDIKRVLDNDKYIGIYSVLSTLDASRFNGKNISEDKWKAVFQYYFELYISSFLLKTIKDYFLNNNGKRNEEEFVKGVSDLFLENINLRKYDLTHLLYYVENKRKEIDIEIENVAFTGSFDGLSINLKSGSLIFGIPEVMRETYIDFQDVLFIYIMDEYEKLLEWQKVYINSLVWEKRQPSTLWIGARKYGYSNKKILTGEELKKGSEYIPIFLDDFYQKNEKEYESFALELISKRLENNGMGTVRDLMEKFQNAKDFSIKLLESNKRGKYKHIRNLNSELTSAIKRGLVTDSENQIKEIIENIVADTNNNPLEQKYKLYLFYQMWSEHKSNSLFGLSEEVKNEYSQHLKGFNTRFKNIVEKYKSDLVAQLCEENGIDYYAYSGLDDLIKLSWGNPRVLLLLLKKIIEISQVLQERPLESGGKISVRAQYLGIKETSKWYLDDSELMGHLGSNINTAINNLASYLRLYRFSEKPTETSVCAFNFGTENVSTKAKYLITQMELHSLLIKIENHRKQRNTGKSENTYQINRILTPYWNLPSARRGIADFNSNEIEVIFNEDFFQDFDSEYKKLKIKMNAPFIRKNTVKEPTLFN